VVIIDSSLAELTMPALGHTGIEYRPGHLLSRRFGAQQRFNFKVPHRAMEILNNTQYKRKFLVAVILSNAKACPERSEGTRRG
jgi:hypothetical protein